MSEVSNSVLILEPNGYNPILKIIEKISRYHIRHEERSFFPSLLNTWFKKNGFKIKEQGIFCLVPYFCSDPMAKVLKTLEPIFEKLVPLNKILCGSFIALYEKT